MSASINQGWTPEQLKVLDEIEASTDFERFIVENCCESNLNPINQGTQVFAWETIDGLLHLCYIDMLGTIVLQRHSTEMQHGQPHTQSDS